MGSSNDDAEWTRLCHTLSRSLRNVNLHTQLLRRAAQRPDNAKKKLREIMEGSNQDVGLVHDTLAKLATYMRLHPGTHKGPVQRMAAEAQGVIHQYEDAHRQLLLGIQAATGGKKSSSSSATVIIGGVSVAGADAGSAAATGKEEEEEVEGPGEEEDKYARFRPSSYGHGADKKKQPLSKRFSAAAQAARDEEDEEDEDASDSKGLLSQHHQQDLVQQQQEDFDQSLHNEIMAERQKDVAEIAENLADIKDIFDHINLLVGEQGEKLDTVEENIGTSVVSMEKGNAELTAARRHVTASNKRTMWFCLAALLLVLVLGAIVVKVS